MPGLREGDAGLAAEPATGHPSSAWGWGPSLVSLWLPRQLGGSGGPEPSGSISGAGTQAHRLSVQQRVLALLMAPVVLATQAGLGSLPSPAAPQPAASPIKTSNSLGKPRVGREGTGCEHRLGPHALPSGCWGAPALAGKVPPCPPPCAAAAAAEPRQGDYEDVSRSGGRREGRRAPDEVLGEPRRVIHVRPCVCV